MDNSLGSAIEKIKREEQNKDAKLKAKREQEVARASAERLLREVVTQTKKLQQEKADLIKLTNELRGQATIQKIRRDALVAQLASSQKELQDLNAKSEQVALELQELRASYCKAVQDVSDECDIWALLTKPSTEPMPRVSLKKPQEINSNDKNLINERRLQNAKEMRDRAIVERERLKSEPDTGEEFVRIKNALRYSLEMTANLRK